MRCIKGWALLFQVFFWSSLVQLSSGQTPSPALAGPSPPPMSNDGKMIDQGIAYVLMLVALLITYLTH
ncbi:Arabinogalactan peptide 16 [Apostasia shenzhenica]|uniref:Arabinogalactan peptide 16 n=1 Tax=Apostasia shenzhenica TaxID=1088818 RepID=A0A2I0AE52_9ASPA|nr:Arabinogalactan peptide 16 [Apostasia shenzhenica]